MRGGAGCGFRLLKNAGPRPAPHKEGERKIKIKNKKRKRGKKENLIVYLLVFLCNLNFMCATSLVWTFYVCYYLLDLFVYVAGYGAF